MTAANRAFVLLLLLVAGSALTGPVQAYEIHEGDRQVMELMAKKWPHLGWKTGNGGVEEKCEDLWPGSQCSDEGRVISLYVASIALDANFSLSHRRQRCSALRKAPMHQPRFVVKFGAAATLDFHFPGHLPAMALPDCSSCHYLTLVSPFVQEFGLQEHGRTLSKRNHEHGCPRPAVCTSLCRFFCLPSRSTNKSLTSSPSVLFKSLTCPCLCDSDLSYNQIQGSLPADLGALSHLYHLYERYSCSFSRMKGA